MLTIHECYTPKLVAYKFKSANIHGDNEWLETAEPQVSVKPTNIELFLQILGLSDPAVCSH